MALPALILSEQQQKILNYISLINDKVEVIFMFIGHGLFVHICYVWVYVVFVCTAFLFPSSGNRALIYCGEPIPYGLAEHMTRSALRVLQLLTVAAVMKA